MENQEGFKTLDVQVLVEDVIASGCLGQSQRQKELLTFLLEQFKDGHSGKLKAYTIAVDVFNRQGNFDDSIDSIVRVEMYRLRKNLKQYNLSSRKYTIKIPRGQYEPTICFVGGNDDPALSGKIIISLFVVGSILVFFFVYSQFYGHQDSATNLNGLAPLVGVKIVSSDFSEDETRRFVLGLESFQPNPGVADIIETQEGETSKKDGIIRISLEKTDQHVIISLSPVFYPSSFGIKKVFKFKSNKKVLERAGDATSLWITNPENELLRRYALSGNRPKSTLTTYQCIIDSIRFFSNDSLKFGSNKRLYDCVTNYKTDDLKESYWLSYIRGILLSYQIKKQIDYEVDEPEKELDKIIEFMKTNYFEGKLVHQLMVQKVMRGHPIDRSELERLLDEAVSKFEFHSKELANLSVYFGIILGNWEKAKAHLDSYFENMGKQNKAFGFYPATAYEIAHFDFEQARKSFFMIPEINAYMIDAFGLTIGCHLKEKPLIETSVSNLAKYELLEWGQYFERIQSNSFNNKLKDILTDEKVVKPCFESIAIH